MTWNYHMNGQKMKRFQNMHATFATGLAHTRNRGMIKFFLVFMCSSFLTFLMGQQIWIDEDYQDWADVDFSFSDPAGDGVIAGVDFQNIRMSNDSENFYIFFDTNDELNLQEDNELTLYIDTDNNAATGFGFRGIGAEIRYFLGNRNGTVHLGNNVLAIGHSDINLISLPTVSSEQFELSIRMSSTISGNTLSFGSTIRVILEDRRFGGDYAPDGNGGITYELINDAGQELPPYAIGSPPGKLRVMSYNVLNDGLFSFSRRNAIRRMIQATRPEIIGFQEIYDHTSQRVAIEMEAILPSQDGEEWYHKKVNPDIIVASRYPIIESSPIDGNGIFKIAWGNEELILVVAHLPCCNNEIQRQQEVDRIVGFIRDAATNPVSFQIENDSPIIIVGDMNLVGERSQQETLITGNIINEGIFGDDYALDWGTPMEDVKPFATGTPHSFTWLSTFSSFGAGRLDYILYSGSILELDNSFTLFTETLPQDSLQTYGLEASDALTGSDHLPCVADFSLREITGNIDQRLPFQKFRVAPNPATDYVDVQFSLEFAGTIRFLLYDIRGSILLDQASHYPSGVHHAEIDLSSVPEGAYFLDISDHHRQSVIQLQRIK